MTDRHNPFGVQMGFDPDVDEAERFAKALQECLIRNRGFADLSPSSVLPVYRGALLGRRDIPRRYGLALPRMAAYSGDTVRRLKNEVLKRFPRWTIVLASSCPEAQEVSVTETSVFTSEQDVVPDIDRFMDQLKQWETRTRDLIQGSTLRQLAYLRPTIQEQMQLVTDSNPNVIVGMFDNSRGRFDRISVWSVAKSCDWTVCAVGSEAMCGKNMPIGEDGAPCDSAENRDEYDRLFDKGGPWLVESVVPASYQGSVFVCEGSIPLDGEQQIKFELQIDRSKMIRDADLPRVELP